MANCNIRAFGKLGNASARMRELLCVLLFPDSENYGDACCHNNCSAGTDEKIPVCCLILRYGDVERHDVACQIRSKVAVTLLGKDQKLVVSGRQI